MGAKAVLCAEEKVYERGQRRLAPGEMIGRGVGG